MKKLETTINGIRRVVEFGEMTVSRVFKGNFDKPGFATAEIKQQVKTTSYYPTENIGNNMGDSLFSAEDLGISEKPFENIETRVAWTTIKEGTSVEEVAAKLKAAPNACIYKVLSNRPILTDKQEYAINSADYGATLDTFANSQVVRYPENHEKAGEIAKDSNGKVQYRQVFLSVSGQDDVDNRTQDAGDFYASETIRAEIQEVMPDDQTL